MSDFIKTEISNSKKTHLSYFRLLKVTILIIIIGILISYFSYLSFKSKIITDETKIIEIEFGDTFQNLTRKFNRIDKFWYKIYLKNNKPNYELQVGNYKIEGNLKIEELINSFKYPIIEEKKITILEGWNIFDIDEYLARKGLINENEYINYSQNKEKINKLTTFFPFLEGLDTLEGFLYPDTYKIDRLNFKINTFIISQLENFEKKVFSKILENKNNKEIIDLIILSSIVEKEEKSEKNKPTVAGILKKRLDEGWMIGADITVCYPYKLTSEECKMVVTKYIGEENEYNTRTMLGLPKTPIGNPSYTTIEATLNYKNSPYYFYLHDKQGYIHYGRTNEEHIQNKNKYLY